jgi:predicted dehydrogenase
LDHRLPQTDDPICFLLILKKTKMISQQPVRIAIIGAGIFARDAHIPAMLALGNTFEIVAICSRREESARALTEKLPNKADVYTDISQLLARQDIEAIDILLPIATMPDVVEQALAAGKHVISEKPIGPDVATARRLLTRKTDKVWMVAENWRFDPAFMQALEVLQRGEIGKPLLCQFAGYGRVDQSVKYYHTDWRRDNSFPGGFLLDGGVHNVAAMRMLLGEIANVSAVLTQIQPDLPPADTVIATLRFESGLVGSYTVTFGVEAPWEGGLSILGEQGALRVRSGTLEVTTKGQTRRISTPPDDVKQELAAFAAAIREGTPHRDTPEEAARDLAVIEAMLKSAKTGNSVQPEKIAS